jgi:hypothetical protein
MKPLDNSPSKKEALVRDLQGCRTPGGDQARAETQGTASEGEVDQAFISVCFARVKILCRML